MKDLPTGTVTFLFTDIEGSTTLLQRLGDRRYAEVLEEHRRLLRDAFAEGHGQEVGTQGDALLVAFPRARDALAAAVTAQQALLKHSWPDGASLRVRMGLHTGEPVSESGDYVGLDVHRAARICAAGHGGQILLSDAVSGLAARDLPPGVTLRDLGPHRLKDLKEPEHLLQVVHVDLQADFPPLKSLDAHLTNLPRQLTSFIGRERDIAEVKRLLPTTSLLTLHGPGGCGKTRLALRVAADLVDEYPDGVWVAELAVLSDPGLVPKAVATALDVPEQPGRALTETLKDALRRRSLLLVLDNCEHLVGSCSEMTEVLLRACPTLRILATSREPLGTSGEIVWDVPSLSVPEQSRVPSPEQLGRFDGVRLFIERAAASRPGFALTARNAASVAQVCSQLEGIPLALELAAARVKVLTVEQIAGRLDDRFRLLTGGRRTALPRHQTLQATMDWSYGLLSEQERTMLRRLSVFAGGWTVEAAEAVCAGAGIDAAHILDLLASLIDKSLVMAETQGGEVRYRLLETIRRYAWERLVGSHEAAEVQIRHRTWYLELAERAEARIHGPEDMTWLNRLEAEHDNLRAALGWSSRQDDDAETRLRLVAALYWFWNGHTHWGEGRKWLDTTVTETRNINSTVRVKVLWETGHLAWRQSDTARAEAMSEESLAMARELHDQDGLAQALYIRGLVALRQGHFDAAIALLDESLDLSRTLQEKWRIAMIHGAMGTAYERLKGDYAKAVTLCETCLAMFRALGSKRWVAVGLHLTGHAVRSNGDFKRAVELYRENLVLFGEVGDKWVATECIEGLALIAAAQGNGERAARLFGAAGAARETYGITMPRREAVLAATKERPQESNLAAAWAEGRAMTLEQAVGYALAEKTDCAQH